MIGSIALHACFTAEAWLPFCQIHNLKLNDDFQYAGVILATALVHVSRTIQLSCSVVSFALA